MLILSISDLPNKQISYKKIKSTVCSANTCFNKASDSDYHFKRVFDLPEKFQNKLMLSIPVYKTFYTVFKSIVFLYLMSIRQNSSQIVACSN